MPANTTRRIQRAIFSGVLVAAAAGAAGQVRAQLPMVGLTSHRPTIGGMPDSGSSSRGFVRVPVTAVVGGGPVIVHPGVCSPARPVIVEESGLTVSGSLDTDNFDLDFRVGPALGATNVLLLPDGRGVCNPWPGYAGGYGHGWYEYDRYRQNRHYVVDSSLLSAPPQPAVVTPPAAPAPLTKPELAAQLMKLGRYEDALSTIREHLSADPGDASALRLMGLALIQNLEFDEGTAVLASAYRADPSLAERRVPARACFADEQDLDRCLKLVVVRANKIETGSAWLAVAVVMQAQNRDDHALRMARRAEALGLDAAIAGPLIAALDR